MERRAFLGGALSSVAAAFTRPEDGGKLALAAKAQLGVTTGYDPRYVRLSYPGGDVPRTTGVCADVVVRAGRDALGLDLQKLVHEDMLRDFAAYPRTWGMHAPDSNIDHRRVLNLEVFWKRTGAAVWTGNAAGDGFEGAMKPGDLLTWLLDGRLPHVGVVVGSACLGRRWCITSAPVCSRTRCSRFEDTGRRGIIAGRLGSFRSRRCKTGGI